MREQESGRCWGCREDVVRGGLITYSLMGHCEDLGFYSVREVRSLEDLSDEI